MAKQKEETANLSFEEQFAAMTPEEQLSFAKSNVEALDKLKAESKEVISDLKSQVDSKKELQGATTVSHEGKRYVFICESFTLPNSEAPEEPLKLTAKEAVKDPQIIAKLVENGSGVLTLKK